MILYYLITLLISAVFLFKLRTKPTLEEKADPYLKEVKRKSLLNSRGLIGFFDVVFILSLLLFFSEIKQVILEGLTYESFLYILVDEVYFYAVPIVVLFFFYKVIEKLKKLNTIEKGKKEGTID